LFALCRRQASRGTRAGRLLAYVVMLEADSDQEEECYSTVSEGVRIMLTSHQCKALYASS
jgi:hypothetical protein